LLVKPSKKDKKVEEVFIAVAVVNSITNSSILDIVDDKALLIEMFDKNASTTAETSIDGMLVGRKDSL
jgi:hypothetical protein